jgi:hypothetical protein
VPWKVKKYFDPDDFRRVWMSADLRLGDIQKHFDTRSSSTLYKVARDLGLPVPRPKPPPPQEVDSEEDSEENCPTPGEIYAATEAIRHRWTEEEEERRRVGPGARWQPRMASII